MDSIPSILFRQSGYAGRTLIFNQPGVYSVKLKVWDNQNNTSTVTKSISISDKAPPPEPPEPENIPPVARFDMVSEASPGVSVPVKNRSYDPDGEILTSDWDVSPAANASLPQDVPVSYADTSWDPDGDPIVAREWQWQKNSGSWQNGQPLDFNALGIGS